MEEVKVEQGTDTKEVQETGAETSVPAKKKNRWVDVLLIVGVLMIVLAGGALLLLEWNNQKANDIYDGFSGHRAIFYKCKYCGFIKRFGGNEK